MRFPLKELTPLLGSQFEVITELGPLRITLSEASELPRRNLPPEFPPPMSLIFEGPADVVLRQDNYVIAHPALGQHLWCIVPVARQPIKPHSAVRNPALHTPQYEVLFA